MLENLEVIIEKYRREATAIVLAGFVFGVILGAAIA
jgi:hypothetical protein